LIIDDGALCVAYLHCVYDDARLYRITRGGCCCCCCKPLLRTLTTFTELHHHPSHPAAADGGGGGSGVTMATDDASCPSTAAIKGKGKVFPYSLPSVGPGADPGVQAVSPQVTK